MPTPELPKHEKAFHFLVGQVLRAVPTADPRIVRHLVATKLLEGLPTVQTTCV